MKKLLATITMVLLAIIATPTEARAPTCEWYLARDIITCSELEDPSLQASCLYRAQVSFAACMLE